MIFFVLKIGRSYENHLILNAYNFLCRHFFENLTGNLIVLVLKNKVAGLFSLKLYFFKVLKDL